MKAIISTLFQLCITLFSILVIGVFIEEEVTGKTLLLGPYHNKAQTFLESQHKQIKLRYEQLRRY